MINLPTISPSQSTQAQPKSLHLKLWLTISVLALLLAALANSGHRYWQNSSSKSSDSQAARTVSLPNLQGAAATEYLKQQNLYGSLSAALTAARYQVHPILKRPDEFAAQNPAQHLHAVFTTAGLELTSTSQEQTQRLRMQLRGAGYGGRLFRASADTVNAQEQRVEIRHTLSSGNNVSSQNLPCKITEWYVNRPSGLEHGFTLDQPPGTRREGERLRLALDISGEFSAKASTDGQAVEFSDKSGQPILLYDHLQVKDAHGKQLVAQLTMAGPELQLEVEDQEAQYPLMIDPTFSQLAYLKASNTSGADEFGHSVAVSGNTIVVGAPHENSESSGVNGDQNNFKTVTFGAAYVFIRNGASLSQQAYLKASNTGTSDNFGTAVAISDDTIVIGAHQEDSDATGVNGDQINDNASNSGAAYVFTRSGTTWSQQAYLKASNTQAGDQFGWSVGISGNTIVVGAKLEDSNSKVINGDQLNNNAPDSGAAYVFTRNGASWFQQAYLKGPNTANTDHFGYSVAISGDTIVVGSRYDGFNNPGAAFVFIRSATGWGVQSYLIGSNTSGGDQFGFSVAISGDTIVVGAVDEDSNATGVNGDQVNNNAGNSGAAYVFIRNGTNWIQQAYLKASNTGASDRFGYWVAVSGDTLVVGAPYEDSLNGDQANNDATESGAAYVFTRSLTIWSQQAYLKASNTQTFDTFGWSVGVSGSTIVVGSPQEDSIANGINGDQTNNSATGAGAVYAYSSTNTAPIITAQAGVTQQQGSPVRNIQIATVNDDTNVANNLSVNVNGDSSATVNGVTVSNIRFSTAGNITADVIASCSATTASFTLQVMDSGGLSDEAILDVEVLPNTPPLLSYGKRQSVALRGALTVNPITGLSDNGMVSAEVLISKKYKGAIAVSSRGVVSFSNAQPAGNHGVTIRTTDNCGVIKEASFRLIVRRSS